MDSLHKLSSQCIQYSVHGRVTALCCNSPRPSNILHLSPTFQSVVSFPEPRSRFQYLELRFSRMVRVTGGAIFCIQMVSIVFCFAVSYVQEMLLAYQCSGECLSTIVFYWIAVNELVMSVYLAPWLYVCFPFFV